MNVRQNSVVCFDRSSLMSPPNAAASDVHIWTCGHLYVTCFPHNRDLYVASASSTMPIKWLSNVSLDSCIRKLNLNEWTKRTKSDENHFQKSNARHRGSDTLPKWKMNFFIFRFTTSDSFGLHNKSMWYTPPKPHPVSSTWRFARCHTKFLQN